MARIIKSEWHQVEKRYAIDIDENTIADVYLELTEEECKQRLQEIEDGSFPVEQFIEDAENENVDFYWDWLDEDDWWTDRKGGYDVTYELE